MNHEEQNRKEKGLQEVALESSSEDGNKPLTQARNHYQSFQNPFSQHDDTETRLQNTLNQHRNAMPIGNMQEDAEASNQDHGENTLNQSETEDGQFESTTEDEQEETENEGIFSSMDGLMPKKLSQRILEFTGIFPEYITDNPILSRLIMSAFPFVIIVFLILIVIIPLGAGKDENGLNEMATYLSYGVVETDEGPKESLMEYLKRGGWCNDTDDCVAYNFFVQFRDRIEKDLQESSGCNTLDLKNTSALIGVMFYNRSTDELLSSEIVDNALFNHYLEEMDYLVEAMLSGDDNELDDGLEDEINDETFCHSIPLDHFKEEIIRDGGYIDEFREDLGTGLSYEEKAIIYEKMITESGNIEINSGIIYTECSGITVVDQSNNIIGTYSLEDYVAGVVTAELPKEFPMESQKALAVAARTYVLSSTNYCQSSIESSSNRQNFTSNISDVAREATNTTAGQVLVDGSGKVFLSEYDSWDCSGQNTCTYNRLPSRETHTVTITDPETYLRWAAGGHGNGMSQVAAADMASSGKNYQEILSFFYSDEVKISNLTAMSGSTSGMMQGIRYTSTAPLHSNATDLRNSGFYPNIGRLMGQCVWYAKNRAQEILYYSNMPDDLKQRAISSIKNTLGNGEAWYRNPDGTIFAKSTDVNQPRAGAIVSWSGGLSACSPACGHVAIIESVNADGTVTISEGWKNGSWNSSSWSTVGYQTVTRSIDYIKQHRNSSGDVYTFNGYVYLLG